MCLDSLNPQFHLAVASKLRIDASTRRTIRRLPNAVDIVRLSPDVITFKYPNTRVDTNEATSILNVLDTYQRASGQVVNMEKSEVSYSRNVRDIDKQMICNQMKVKTVEHHSRYLGLPVVFGRSKRDIFSFVQERVWKKLKGRK